MKIEDSILDFLDGNLSSHDEEELLHRLAVSPERRAVLKQHLQVRELSSALARKHNYVVPKAITAQLFHTLATAGYAGPMFHTSADHAAALEQSLMKNVERSAQTVASSSQGFRSSSLVLSSLFSFVVGAFLMYFLIPGLSVTDVPTMAAATRRGELSPQNNIGVSRNEVSASAMPSRDANMRVSTNRTNRNENSASPQASSLSGAITNDNDLALSSIRVHEGNLLFALRHTNVSLSNASLISDGYGTDFTTSQEAITVTTALQNVRSRNWYDGRGILSSDMATEYSLRSFFGYEADNEEPSSIIERTTASLRSGGGHAPGNSQSISASLIEMKFSADITDWLVAKVSFGQFMPYETEATNKGLNADGVRSLKLESILQYKSIVGAEIGVRFKIFGAPIEMMGGVLSDMKDAVIPRASIFSSFMLQDNLSLHIGAEAILYQHDVRTSLRDKQNLFAADHPVLVSTMKEKELGGFIGPAIELAWHF